MDNVIEMENVTKSFKNKDAVQNMSFTVKKEKFSVFLAQAALEKRRQLKC